MPTTRRLESRRHDLTTKILMFSVGTLCFIGTYRHLFAIWSPVAVMSGCLVGFCSTSLMGILRNLAYTYIGVALWIPLLALCDLSLNFFLYAKLSLPVPTFKLIALALNVQLLITVPWIFSIPLGFIIRNFRIKLIRRREWIQGESTPAESSRNRQRTRPEGTVQKSPLPYGSASNFGPRF